MKKHTKRIKKLSKEIISLISDKSSIPRLEQLRVKEYKDRIEKVNGEKLVIIPWSGGLDSTTCLLMALESSCKVQTVFFDYGQSYANKERKAIERILSKLNGTEFSDQLISHVDLDISWLADDMADLFPGDWRHIFPMRNLIILLLATEQSDHDFKEVWFGAVQGEIPFSGGDKSEVFTKYMRKYLLNEHNTVLHTPLSNITKGDMVNWAAAYKSRLDIIKETVSCFDSRNDSHCSQCQACFNRAVGFYNADKLDASGLNMNNDSFKEHARSYIDKLKENDYYSFRRRDELNKFIKELL